MASCRVSFQTRHPEVRALASLEGCAAKIRRQRHAVTLRGLRFVTAPLDDGYGRNHCASATTPRKLVGAELAGDLVEYRIHHTGLVAIDKGVCDVDIFGHHDAAGDV